MDSAYPEHEHSFCHQGLFKNNKWRYPVLDDPGCQQSVLVNVQRDVLNLGCFYPSSCASHSTDSDAPTSKQLSGCLLF